MKTFSTFDHEHAEQNHAPGLHDAHDAQLAADRTPASGHRAQLDTRYVIAKEQHR